LTSLFYETTVAIQQGNNGVNETKITLPLKRIGTT